MKKIKKLLFPTDFSEAANHALGQALQLPDMQDVEVIVQHVVDDYFGPHTHWASLFDVHGLQKELDMHIENEIQKTIPKSATGIKLRPVISKGKPDEEIVKRTEAMCRRRPRFMTRDAWMQSIQAKLNARA